MQTAPQAHAELSVVGYRFVGCELNLGTRQLTVEGEPRSLEPQTFEVLAYLIARRHRVVVKRELHDALWQGRAVCEGALTQCIWTARRALASAPGGKALIKTLNGVGYRFVGDVVELAPEADEQDDWRREATVARLDLARALLRSPAREDRTQAEALARQCADDGTRMAWPWLVAAAKEVLTFDRPSRSSGTRLRAVHA